MTLSFADALEGSHDGADRRRAALALHAMSPPDRQWILDRLDPARRAIVEPLVKELDTLGFTRLDSGAWTSQQLRARRAVAHSAPGASARQGQLAVDSLAEVLRHEPPALIDLAVSLQSGPCASELAHRLMPERPLWLAEGGRRAVAPRLASSIEKHLSALAAAQVAVPAREAVAAEARRAPGAAAWRWICRTFVRPLPGASPQQEGASALQASGGDR